jgi:hypothetical protein
MKQIFLGLLLVALAVGCSDITEPVDAGLSLQAATESSAIPAKKGPGSVDRPFKLSRSELSLDWGIERDWELACGGDEIAGGESSGFGNFTHLGRTEIHMSAAWDIGARIADPTQAEFTPVSPAAAGPFAPVYGSGDYPIQFRFNPFTGQCDQSLAATGTMRLTAANGDEVHGVVTGGETHRLDFIQEGDGIETFAIVSIDGGTGRFAGASGSFVVHTITRFDFDHMAFVIDLTEVLPGGTISY